MTNNVKVLPSGTIVREEGRSHFFNKTQLIHMEDCTMVEGVGRSRDDQTPSLLDGRKSLFPRFKECAHFHYESVNMSSMELSLVGERFEVDPSRRRWFYVLVTSVDRGWTIKRNVASLCKVDRLLHRCVFSRPTSRLPEFDEDVANDTSLEKCFKTVRSYIETLSILLRKSVDSVTCGPILFWLEVDNRGNHVSMTEMESSVNIPAVGAARVVRPYVAQSSDELTFEVGDIISIIDKPPPHETTWWQGKKDFKVGYFPSEFVELITVSGKGSESDAIDHQHQNSIKPVLRKREKFVAFLLSFFAYRPNKVALKKAGIVRERLFGCDLGEHLSNHGDAEVPAIVNICLRFVEERCLTDGVYRLSGSMSGVQKLRNEFDAENQPDLYSPDVVRDIHCVPSLVKMYFRELPNPLLTYQLYDRFLEVDEQKVMATKVRSFACLMNLLPPPHYRTAKVLFLHLHRMASRESETSMNAKNLSIIWAPNVLRPRHKDTDVDLFKRMNSQASAIRTIIENAESIFTGLEIKQDSKLLRPLSSANCPAKLISLEEAQRIFGGKRNNNTSKSGTNSGQQPLDSSFPPRESAKPLYIHSIIDLPKGYVGRKKNNPSKPKWFKSYQDLPNLQSMEAKPVEMVDFKRIGSTKRDSSPIKPRASLDDVPESPSGVSDSKPFSASDPNMIDSLASSSPPLSVQGVAPTPMTKDPKAAVSIALGPATDGELEKSQNQAKVSSRREPGDMLKKMEMFLQGEVIAEEEESVPGVNASREGEIDVGKQASTFVSREKETGRKLDEKAAIMRELIKWRESKMNKIGQVRPGRAYHESGENAAATTTAAATAHHKKLVPSLSLDRCERSAVELRHSFVSRIDGGNSDEDRKPREKRLEKENVVDSRGGLSCREEPKNVRTAFQDKFGSRYFDARLPKRDFSRRSRKEVESAIYPEGTRLEDYQGMSVSCLPGIPTIGAATGLLQLSSSCGDLFDAGSRSPRSSLHPHEGFQKSNSNETIDPRISCLQKPRCDRLHLLQPPPQDRRLPAGRHRASFVHLQRPDSLATTVDRSRSTGSAPFVTVVKLDPSERSHEKPPPGATVIML